MTLRTDLHQFFDAKHFAIVPRTSTTLGAETGEVTGLFVCMLTRDCGIEMAKNYHDVKLQPLPGVPLEFVWCRFMWAVEGIVQKSINLNLKRRLLKWNVATSSTEVKEETYIRPKSRAPSPAKGRNSSPQKRDVDGAPITRKRSFSGYNTDSSTRSSVFDDHDNDTEDDGQRRGRAKQRRESLQSNSSAQTSFESLKSQWTTTAKANTSAQNT